MRKLLDAFETPEPTGAPAQQSSGTDKWAAYRTEPRVENRNALVEEYSPLVKYNAERIWAKLPNGVELDDLISAGTFGLLDAIEAFDVSRGVKFETYCVPRIRGAMLDELRHMDWVPRLVRSRATKLQNAKKSLENSLGRQPKDEEVAEYLGMSLDEFHGFTQENTAVGLVSLNKKWYETDSYKDVREIDIIEDKKAEQPDERQAGKDILALMMRGLNRTERLIIIGYYSEERTMKEIGADLSMSESRVSQIHSSIITRMQTTLWQKPEFEDQIRTTRHRSSLLQSAHATTHSRSAQRKIA